MQRTIPKRALPFLRSNMHLPPTATHLSSSMDIFPQAFQTPRHPSRHTLPSVWMRAGTSKGLFIHRKHLPASQADWSPILLSAMGSKNGDRRQLNGIGGASSTTSKIAIIEKSNRIGVDIDYTFVQVALNEAKIDVSGNCGNMASGVGPFAVDEGLVPTSPGEKEITIRIYNTNTKRIIHEVVQVDEDGYSCEDGDFELPGLPGGGSPIKVKFIEPAGSMTGKLLPTGQPQDWLDVYGRGDGSSSFSIRVSLVDAANPFVWVDAMTLPEVYRRLDTNSPELLVLIENVRRAAAVRCGLASTIENAALTRGTPKIGLLYSPYSQEQLSDGDTAQNGETPDTVVTSFSMGQKHPSLQLTGAICLAAGVSIPGTVPYELSRAGSGLLTPPEEEVLRPTPQSLRKSQWKKHTRKVRIRHSTGNIEVDVDLESRGAENIVKAATVYRTARRLFEGNVNIGR